MSFTEFTLTQRFQDAFALALRLHCSQTRKNIHSPYMTHLLAVTSLVCENIGFLCDDPERCESYAMIAVLHDTVEDQGGARTLDLLRQTFGSFIADGVMALSDAIPAPNGQKAPKAVRNRLYLEKMHSDSPELVLISCCDKIHNLRTMVADYLAEPDKTSFWKSFSASPHDTAANYRRLGDLYAQRLAGQRVVTLFREALINVERILPTPL